MLPIIPPHPADIRLYNSSVFSPINAKEYLQHSKQAPIYHF